MNDYAAMNAVWDAWVPQGDTPARATVEARLAANAKVQRALLHLKLRNAVVEIRHRNARLLTEPPRAVVDRQLGARVVVGP